MEHGGNLDEVAPILIIDDSVATSPKGGRRIRPRKRSKGHVHWDEEAIAEHDKERGTRQKIDEPDTPFIRSPQTASDSEGDRADSDEEQRLRRAIGGATGSSSGPSAGSPDVDAKALASRLDLWLESGANQRRPSTASSGTSEGGVDYHADNSGINSACSSRSSSFSAPATHARRRNSDESGASEGGRATERRISLPDDSPQPKPTSATFRAKRAQHYNEVAALKSFRKRPNKDGDSTPESDTSDENFQVKTNTNTNINQTSSKGVDGKVDRKGDKERRGNSSNSSTSAIKAPCTLASHGSCSSDGSQAPETEQRSRGVSFSEGESGNESREEFKHQRRDHYAHEWTKDPKVAAEVSSLETNTNTNMNIGLSCKGRVRKHNPMEGGRPPVQFGEGEAEPSQGRSSEEFTSHRRQHYDEVAAIRRFKEESRGQDEEEEDDDEPDETEDAGTEEPGVVEGGTSKSMKDDAWKSMRQAHYNDMAAALRSMPPPSDEEDSSEGD